MPDALMTFLSVFGAGMLIGLVIIAIAYGVKRIEDDTNARLDAFEEENPLDV